MKGRRPRLVCIGDLTLDIVARHAADVEAGTDVAGTIRFRAGGSAANTARAFAGLGGSATFIGAVGNGTLGGLLKAALRTAGVTVHVTRSRGPTARLVVLVAPGGERSFVTDRGVADGLAWRSIKPAWLSRADAVHLPAYSLLVAPLSETALAAARLAHTAGALVSVDLASRRPLLADGPAAALARISAVAADILFANRDEAAALVGTRRLRRLLELAPVAVVKEGAAGCRVMWIDAQSGVLEIEVATRPVAAADTTGAGDAFDAGFLHALISAGVDAASPRRAAQLRRAAVAGHRAAARLLAAPRWELSL